MAHLFLFLCPVCGAEDSISGDRCRGCGARIERNASGFVINGKTHTPAGLLDWMRRNLAIDPPEASLKNGWPQVTVDVPGEIRRVSRKAVLRQGIKKIPFRGYRNLLRREIELPLPIDEGYLVITREAVYFAGNRARYEFKLTDITCVTTNSHYFEFKLKKKPFYQIEFLSESPLKYEILFQKLLNEFYDHQNQTVIEYQPHIRFKEPACPSRSVPPNGLAGIRQPLAEKLFVAGILQILRLLFPVRLRYLPGAVPGLPREYPVILLSNHQSVIDPFLILAFLNPGIAFFTKSTSFAGKIERFFLTVGRGIPTTRYQADPQVYADARRFLERGIPLGIFPEGERSWDGRQQPFKIGVVRLLCHLKVPIFPVGFLDAYRLWPRWQKWPARQPVELAVGSPFCLNISSFSVRELKLFLEEHIRRLSGG